MAPDDARDVPFALKERAMDEAPVGITISDPAREDNPLIYVNDAFERLTGYARQAVIGRNCRFLQGPDTDPGAVAELRAGIEAARPVTVELRNYRRDGEPFWNEVTVAPLRDADGEVTNYVGFQVDVTERKEAQLALAAERERLDRLLDRINGLLADVTEILIQGVDRRETERAVVERLAATDAYAAAWLGEPDLARDVLVTAAAAGFEAPLDDLAVDLGAGVPAARAYRERTVETAEVGADDAFESAAPSGPVVAVPLVYGDAIYGVLVVQGVSADALDDRERVVLAAVGRMIATAVNAVQSRRALSADDVVELEFAIRDRAFVPVALADARDCRLAYRGAASGETGLRLFVDVEDGPGRPAEPVGDLRGDVDGVESVTRVGDADSTLLEVRLAPGSVIERLAERGAAVRSLTAADGVGELAVVVPAEVGGRVVLELLEDRYDGVELLAHRERDPRPATRAAFGLEADLTERQATALRSAYFGGYYDEPRTVSGDELAEMMGVSRPTFHQHLRAAERKVFAALLEGTSPHTY